MQAGLCNTIRVSLAALIVMATCLASSAQQPPLDELARRMADSLAQAKQKNVAVFGFVGPDETEALGQKIAGDFHEALLRSAHSFRVEDLSQLLEILGKTSAWSASVDDADTASWFLRDSDVDTAILGTASNEGAGLHARVRAIRVRDAQQIAEFDTVVPLTDDLKRPVGRTAGREFANWPRGGKNGYSSPICVSCPKPQYLGRPLGRRSEGTVVLEISVGEDGRARHIRIKKAAPYGMTKKAIAAVQTWRYKPATGPDGKVAAVRETVEMNFLIF